jgi:hypothetical protein
MRVRGIYSNKSINSSDDNDKHLKKTIEGTIQFALGTFKNGAKFLEELYYTVKNPASVKINTEADTTTSPYSGISIVRLTDSNYQELPHSYTITSVMYRIKMPSLDALDLPGNECHETLTITTPAGNLTAVATYYDPGTTFATEFKQVDFMVLNGIGKYKFANLIRIFYNNETLTRRIAVYTYL